MKDKFQRSPDIIKGLCGSLIDGHPIIFRWANLKGVDTNLIELFDQKGHLSWCSPREYGAKFACDSASSSILNSPGYKSDLRLADENNMVYHACISPLWILVHSYRRPRYTHYPAHQVLRQFGFGLPQQNQIFKNELRVAPSTFCHSLPGVNSAQRLY